MGTSVNQRSPSTPNWRLVQDAYDDPKIAIDQALREVWRAASNPNEVNLTSLLTEPVVASFADVAARSASPAQAFEEMTRVISDSKVSSLATDIAKRAVIQSAGRENPAQVYTERLFAEATNYLVSRDLPGHVTPGSRLQNVGDARRFTQQIMETAVDAVRRTGTPRSLMDDWSGFVNSVVSTIRRRR